MFLIDKLQYLVFHTPRMNEMVDYYERVLGMIPVEGSPESEVWLGQFSNTPALILRKDKEASLRETGFQVRGEEQLQEIKHRLEKKGIYFEEYTTETFGKTLSFNDMDEHPLRLHISKNVSEENPKRAPRVGPQLGRLQHVTYASPAPYKLARFYEEVLGFRISDMVQSKNFVWFRTDADHHTVSAAAHTKTALDHYAFELPDWEAFKEWCDHLSEQGVDVVWGPGRHGAGNNLFIFTIDPDGNRVEYSAEMEKFWDGYMEYTPRIWEDGPKTVNLWGQGPPWPRELPQ